jgi:hypothetical protein
MEGYCLAELNVLALVKVGTPFWTL